jgi:hypothetical protein
MDERSYISEIRKIFSLAPQQRLQAMISFHLIVCETYCQAVSGIEEARAESKSSDGRSIKQVVGHIMEWDRFTLLCYGQLLSGVKTRKILWKTGYTDSIGEPYNFNSIEAFNNIQAERQALVPWVEIQVEGMRLAKTLQTLLSLALITPQLLEDTEVISPELYDGQRLPIASGWFLWCVILDHEAVDHATDLYN